MIDILYYLETVCFVCNIHTSKRTREMSHNNIPTQYAYTKIK